MADLRRALEEVVFSARAPDEEAAEVARAAAARTVRNPDTVTKPRGLAS